jgi:hypothetical protein
MAQEAQLGARAYRMEDMLAELRRGVFTELAGADAIAAPRRSLQRHYIDTLVARLNFPSLAGLDDGQAALRAELRELKGQIAARAGQGDRTRRAHLQDLVDTIDKALDPRFAPAANPLAALLRGMGYQAEPAWAPDDQAACWPGPALPVAAQPNSLRSAP